MAKETKEVIVGLGQKLRLIITAPAVVMIEPMRSTTKTIGAAIMHSRFVKDSGDHDLKGQFDSACLALITAYRLNLAAQQLPGSDNEGASYEFDDRAADFSNIVKKMHRQGTKHDWLEERIGLVAREITIGESSFGERSKIIDDATEKAKYVLLDAFTEPEITRQAG